MDSVTIKSVKGNPSLRMWRAVRTAAPCCAVMSICLYHICNVNTLTLLKDLQAFESHVIVQAGDGAKDCRTWDKMDNSFLLLFFHLRDDNARSGRRWEEQGTHAVMSLITPAEWQHKGKGHWMAPTAWINDCMMIKGITYGVRCLGANHISTTYMSPYLRQIT